MMKYLILVLVVLVVIWLGKSSRGKVEAPRKPRVDEPPAEGEVMLTCAHCGMHLPRSEALPGRGGVFCSEAHRAVVEARHGSG